MDPAQSPNEIAQQLQEEHASLQKRLAEVRAAIQDESGEDHLVAILQWFYDEVQEHFDREEQDGGFDDALSLAPRLSAKAAALMRQHTALLSVLSELLAAARGGDREQLVERFDTFAAKWLHHESEENRLLQEAYNEDLGTSD